MFLLSTLACLVIIVNDALYKYANQILVSCNANMKDWCAYSFCSLNETNTEAVY